MASDYKHISIEEDDEEEVFVVGARAVQPASAAPVMDAIPEPELAPGSQVPAPAAVSAAPAGDLDVPPMSLLQKIIIGFAAIGVVVLIAYLITA